MKIEERQSIEEARNYRLHLVSKLTELTLDGQLDLTYDYDGNFGFEKIGPSGNVVSFLNTSDGRQTYLIKLEDLITDNLLFILNCINR